MAIVWFSTIIFFHLFIGIYYNGSCLKEGGVGGKPLNKPFKKNWAQYLGAYTKLGTTL